MRRSVRHPHLHATAAAAFLLLLIAAPAARAASLFDVGATGARTANIKTDVISHLPTWVQVVSATAPLYSSESGAQQTGASVVRHLFLRVTGGGASRLQVDAYDDYGKVTSNGWVDLNQVTPSAPGINWLVAAKATTLWRGADTGADAARQIDHFTPFQMIDGPVHGRVNVQVYRSDFSGVVDQGWVDVSDTGPALAPRTRVPAVASQTRVPSATDHTVSLRVSTATDQQQAFLDAAATAARQSAAQTGVPASVTVAQAILESDWGRSQLSTSANNYFGIKAVGTLGTDGVVWLPTFEYDDSGSLYQTLSAFRAYKSLTDSMTDHDRLLSTASRYSSAMWVASDPKQFARMLLVDGYSTDPAYADKLISLMDRYDLYRLDS